MVIVVGLLMLGWFIENMNEKIPPNLELQIKVSKMLSFGFVCSIFWIGGIGSLIAFVYGWKAKKLLNQTNEEIVGIKMAWWCIIVGGIGMIAFPLIIIFR